jgi:hypothetical protein
MIYVKFNYKGAWFFYGPWKDVAVHYGCGRNDQKDKPSTFSFPNCDPENTMVVDEIFQDVKKDHDSKPSSGYTVITGWEEGQFKGIALLYCQAYLLTAEGKTLERI